MPDALAALDCGSNSTRLFIVDANDSPVTRQTVITRLSAGVDEHGTLGEEAMERTFAVLRTYRAAMDEAAVGEGLLVATSAVRDATNGEAFLERAGAIVGVPARILSGAQEANYSYRGATAELDESDLAFLIVDIGGGSTELALKAKGELCSFSMQLGCVRVAERVLGYGVVSKEREVATEEMIKTELDRAFRAQPVFDEVVGRVRLVGLAGTVATLVAMERGVEVYERSLVHHQRLDRAVVETWRERLAGETPAQRLAHPGMSAGREDVLVAGLYVLEAVMDRFGVTELLSSESDILDGITTSLRESAARGS
ncbi:MAG TPA: hypothetical protein VNE22_04780 [Acidimicrobiales bacterium]|nr:hypothetical protein [Acidimicrobiales bacterium]